MTFLDGLDRDYIDGALANSTFAVGRSPVAPALVEEQAILYVVNSGDDSVTLLDAPTGAYAGDPTGRNDLVAAHDLAVDESANRLFASWRWSSFESASQSLAMLSGGSRSVLNTVSLSSQPFWSTTPLARSVDVEVNALDAHSGYYLNGSLATSSVTAMPD